MLMQASPAQDLHVSATTSWSGATRFLHHQADGQDRAETRFHSEYKLAKSAMARVDAARKWIGRETDSEREKQRMEFGIFVSRAVTASARESCRVFVIVLPAT
jgi:hypothetical protein